MKDAFLEIAFQAEVSRYEDPDFEEIARKNCNEDFNTRHKVIEELRTMIRVRGECNPRRLDDEYLLRFLRCRRFIPALAHKLLVRYEEFRHKYAYLYDCDAFGLQKVKNVYGGMYPESPDNGRIIIMRFSRWDTETVPIEDVVRCALLMGEIAIMQPKLQILGATIIVDLSGLSLRHITHLTPTVASQIVSLMGVGFPGLVHEVHVINYNWIINSISYLFKQFIPQAMWKRMYFHWSNMASLHQYINPQYLPNEYGGCNTHFISTEKWIERVDAYKDDYLVKELRELGFHVKGGSDKVHSHWSYTQLIARVNERVVRI